jgi:hypothetical protein
MIICKEVITFAYAIFSEVFYERSTLPLHYRDYRTKQSQKLLPLNLILVQILFSLNPKIEMPEHKKNTPLKTSIFSVQERIALRETVFSLFRGLYAIPPLGVFFPLQTPCKNQQIAYNNAKSGNSSGVEHRLPKPRVAGSNPVFRSIFISYSGS